MKYWTLAARDLQLSGRRYAAVLMRISAGQRRAVKLECTA
jgi:hypothetical protein